MHTIVTDFKIALAVIVALFVLEVTRRGHRHIRRRRHASLTMRENIPLGRKSWITIGHRFRE